MPEFTILYDEPQEAKWFKSLHPALKTAREVSISSAMKWPSVSGVLGYDRPDIVLLDGESPILVVEETVEVPSGHNVGQRFARLAAAAESGVPTLYFGPYVAKKHGGDTAGPRYMNARLFHALNVMGRVTRTTITTINWPVDDMYEVCRGRAKDRDVVEYLTAFLEFHDQTKDLKKLNLLLAESNIHKRMITERDYFVANMIKKPEQYDGPPPSVTFLSAPEFRANHKIPASALQQWPKEIVLYNVGMNNIRSDPYTGMALLYHYLYKEEHDDRALVLWFPNIKHSMWKEAAKRASRKDIRLYRIASDAILFHDKFLQRSAL